MREAAITQSPHVFVPKEHLTEKEREELYRTRLDESFRPYTVIDVLTKVFHREFADDLQTYIGEHPEEFKTSGGDWKVARAWVNELRIIRPESIFQQPSDAFCVDILVETKIRLEEVKRGAAFMRNRYALSPTLRLRYCFDFRPCHMECHFAEAILKESDSLQARYPGAFPMDKYLIPVMSAEDYAHLAEDIHRTLYEDEKRKDEPIDPEKWIREMGLKLLVGIFPENGALGEYFFGFGTADIVNQKSGDVAKKDINPGTIILNNEILHAAGTRNSTTAHEGTHGFLGHYFFMLQRMHGHDYCSYMCKRVPGQQDADLRSPMEKMEIQANTFPRYLLIPEESGKSRAERLLAYYGGIRDLATMQKMVNDMAEYYGTTKTIARSRLMDFGYNEARGILRTANGSLVPSYYSTLSANETYTISESEALQEYLTNTNFQTVVNSGLYLYVPENGCYCLNDRKYLYLDHAGHPHLRRYAREHMDKCCLVFCAEYTNVFRRFINGVLQKGSTVGRGRRTIRYVNEKGGSPATEAGLMLRKQIEAQMQEAAKFQKTFNDMTVELMESRGITVGRLADETGLSEDTIKNLRNRPNIIFPIQEIVAVCIALHLPPAVSMEYIRISPSKFQTTLEMKMYEYALNQWYMRSVAEVNRLLVEAEVRPLTNLVDGFDENGRKEAGA